MHELWKHDLQGYIDFLVEHRFNAVRLPLSAQIVGENQEVGGLCGEYYGWQSLDILDDLVLKLQRVGIFVMFDMHTLEIDVNNGMWCYTDVWGDCDTSAETLVWDAWETLARRYCSSPNVIAADLFNEPVRWHALHLFS